MGHVQRPTWSGASRPLAECSILLGGRIPDLVHRQTIQHSKGPRRLPPPVFPPTAFNLSTVTPVTSAELRVSSLNLLRNHVNSTLYLPPCCRSSSTSFSRF